MALPSSIASVDAWYNATDPTTLESDVGIDKWKNKISDVAHLEQAVGARQPTTSNPAGPNQLNALKFVRASDQHLLVSVGGITRTQPFEVWMAIQIDAGLATNTMRFWDGNTTQAVFELRNTDGATRIFSGSFSPYGTVWPDMGTMHVVRVLYKDTVGDPDQSQWWVDDVSFGGPGNSGATGLEDLIVGAAKGIVNPIDGKIGEVIVSNAEITGSDLANLWAYMSRWTTPSGKGVTFDTAFDTAHDTARDTTKHF